MAGIGAPARGRRRVSLAALPPASAPSRRRARQAATAALSALYQRVGTDSRGARAGRSGSPRRA
eukprot:scaffold20367_cov100-Isochrysis_galbana.AAC.3